MARPFEFALTDLGGGMNDGISPAALEAREMASVRNFYPYGKHLIRRQGSIKLTSSAHSELITGLFALKLSTSSWALIALAKTGINRLSGATLTALTNADSITLTTTEAKWQARQYKETGYAVRSNVTGIVRFNRTDFYQAGIEAPTSGSTIADGGSGGSVEAGDYVGVVTFVDTTTDNESNPGPVSNTVTIAADGSIRNWSSIPVSSDAKVNARRLYITLPDQTGEYYLAATINDNTTTSYSDEAGIEDLGGQASFRNGTPPALQFVALELWKERSWVSDGADVYFSEAGLAECFAETNLIQVYPDDGHQVTVLHSYGDRLVVGKTNAIHFITGSDQGDFTVQTLSDRHGCIARDSMKSAEGNLWWFSGENVYQSDGSNVFAISDPKVRTILDAIPEAQKSMVVGAVLPRLGLYMLSVHQDSDGYPKKLLVYSYRNRAWSYYDYPDGAPFVMGDYYDAELETVIYAAFYSNNHIYDLTPDSALDEGTDFGTAITASFKTPAYEFRAKGRLHTLRDFLMECQDVGSNATVKLYRDQESTASKTRSDIYLYQGRRLKRYNMRGMSKKAYQTQLEFIYTGAAALRIEGMFLQGLLHVDEGWQEQPN